MTTTMTTHAVGHSHHPNYVAIFIWLVILTAIEVSIPEFVAIAPVGPDPRIPTVSEVTLAQGEAPDADEVTRAAASMAPRERFNSQGWASKIIVLMILALVKAGMVAAFFMHLRFDGWRLCAVMAVPTLLWVIIIVMTYPDIGIHWPILYPWLRTP